MELWWLSLERALYNLGVNDKNVLGFQEGFLVIDSFLLRTLVEFLTLHDGRCSA